MAAYAVFFREETHDQSALDTYVSKLLEKWPAFEAFSPRILAATGQQQVIEGDTLQGAVILEFPSVELAKQWYESPEYQTVLQHRLQGGRFRSVIVPGVDSAPKENKE